MSKFTNLMHLLDIEHPIIKDREFPPKTRPLDPQQVAHIKLKLPDQDTLPCGKCQFCNVVFTKGKIDELGIGGFMSNQKDGLKPVANAPTRGVTLRRPTTIIRGEGQAFACTNRDNPREGMFFLTKDTQKCKWFAPREEPPSEKTETTEKKK